MTETVCDSAVKANVFRGSTNLSGEQSDANVPQTHRCHVPNPSVERGTVRTPLGLNKKCTQLPVLHSKHPGTAADPEALQMSFQLQLQRNVPELQIKNK